ncbi:Major Facilitator Superfamily (MFS) [Thraustotheca clavata]|uniref:Major Facilitator Superfamily (MFS) n=1 Tax=Thraustotheca clavata TaxID=74557 RepID=A0A1V9ZJE9_9STRA|nr:Major Facilitator Superfamily (MFS) [Thraustotheca clavata]
MASNENTNATEGSRMYAVVVCVFASLGGIFFGYDQGVTGGVLVMDSFLEDFCINYDGNTNITCHAKPALLPQNWINYTTLFNVLYYIGCILGAYVGGFIADRFGRRATIFSAGVFFCFGIGVGNSSFSLPIFGAEMAPKELRGLLSGFMQMSIVTGILLAGIINIVVEKDPKGWRTTNAIAMIFPVIVMAGIFFLPESPRWLYKVKGRAAAETTLKRLRRTENVQIELNAIGDALEEEGSSNATWADLWQPAIRPRLIIAMLLQLLNKPLVSTPSLCTVVKSLKTLLAMG